MAHDHAYQSMNTIVIFYAFRALLSASLTLLGVYSPMLQAIAIPEWHFPEWVMQLFQIGAWSAAIATGAFTCYGVWRTHHGKKRKK
jgi:hypothetical protein